MDKTLFILLGATGDLVKRKLLPALYQLVRRNIIGPVYIVGAAQQKTTAESIVAASKPFMSDVEEKELTQFIAHFSYCQMDFSKTSDFQKLATLVNDVCDRFAILNRVVYAATPAHFFSQLTQQLASATIVWHESERSDAWCRMVFEKPFGTDKESAHGINQDLARYLSERQIYRVDHYLGKDIIGSIALLRFTNRIFEPLWNRHHVAWVQIDLSETIGIGHRGGYYDAYGALKDVVQNHMLQILALIAMESPKLLTGDHVRDQKARVLQQTNVVDGLLGQYDGYLSEPGVNQTSTTETFSLLKLAIENERWRGVPFYLKTGKNLNKHQTRVIVQFKEVDCLLAQRCPSDPDFLTIQIQPEARFGLSVNVKKPGLAAEVAPVLMDFCYEHYFKSTAQMSGYEAVLEEVVRGEQSISVRFDEIEYAWSIIDQAYSLGLPLYTYQPNTSGPKEIELFAQKNGWKCYL